MMAAAVASSRASRAAQGYSRRSGSERWKAASSSEPGGTALLVMGVLSTGLVIGGIWYLASAAQGNREQLEEQYAAAIAHWQEARKDFGHLHITASTSHQVVNLNADVTPDRLRDSEVHENVQLPAYEGLSFVTRRLPDDFLPAAEFESLLEHNTLVKSSGRSSYPRVGAGKVWGPSISMKFKLEDDSGFGDSMLETHPFPVVHALIKNAPTPAPELKCKRELKGLYRAGMCWVFYKLTRICVQIGRDALSKKWQFLPRLQQLNQSYGCDYASGEWAVPHYERVPAPVAHGFARFDNFTIQVRSIHDPYLSVLELTQGRLDLGMTADDDRSIGIVMLILGLVIGCPPSLAAYRAYKRFQRTARELDHPSTGRRRYHDNDDSEMYGIGGMGGYEFESEGFAYR